MTKSFADELEQMINSQGETPRAAPMPATVAIAERDAQRAAQRAAAPVAKTYPALTAIVTAFAHVTIGEIGFSKKNGEPLWWVKSGDALVGKLDADGLQLWNGKIAKAALDRAKIEAALDEIERDPKLALAAHGHATGSCGCCGRELTDPVSIERGIGPICAAKIGF